MNPHSSRSRLFRNDGLTPLALAAGLAFGHLLEAMADSGQPGAVTMVSALVFIAAASAGTVCGLVAMAARHDAVGARARVGGWVAAIGAGLLLALAPALV